MALINSCGRVLFGRVNLLLFCLITPFWCWAQGSLEAQKKSPKATDNPLVEFTTSHGSFTLELHPSHAPLTVVNFLNLIDQGFYQDLIFHRVEKDFVIQTGGFDLNYQQRKTERSIKNESFKGLSNQRGTVAMARTSDPDSATSQFFINLKDNAFLDSRNSFPGYTVFAKVISGMEVIDRIATVKTRNLGGNFSRIPLKPVLINDAKRIHHDSAQR